MSITYFACGECVPGGFWVVVFRLALGLAPFFPATTDRSQSESYQVTVTNYLLNDNYFLNDNIDNAGKIIIIIKSHLTDLLDFYLKYNYLFTQCAVFLFISHQ